METTGRGVAAVVAQLKAGLGEIRKSRLPSKANWKDPQQLMIFHFFPRIYAVSD